LEEAINDHGGDLVKTAKDGVGINFDVHTNADGFVKDIFNSCGCCNSGDSKAVAGFLKMFLTNGSKIHVSADEFAVFRKPFEPAKLGLV